MNKRIRTALVSVFDKTGIDKIIRRMHELGIEIYSTGGTKDYIDSMSIPVTAVEDLTGYPSILGGRVKTLHPKIFGGILGRRDLTKDLEQLSEYKIPEIDLVIVDLYPFEQTVASGKSHEEVVEKIDIGGVSLIRAAAKNYQDVVVICSGRHYPFLESILDESEGQSSYDERKKLARIAFDETSRYDSQIWRYFDDGQETSLKVSESKRTVLRYGENPHQRGYFFGDLSAMFDKISGKELSYNNLLDVDAAIMLMQEFQADQPAFAILKHNNACGMAVRKSLSEAYSAALACDPVSAFGGILISNTIIDHDTAQKINDLFCEVVIAPGFEAKAREVLTSKPNRILLLQKSNELPATQFRTLLNGVIFQDRDLMSENEDHLDLVTNKPATKDEIRDLLFANRLVKHTRSNTIVLAKGQQLCASGTGQTSRVDALVQAIAKAKEFSFDLNGAVMASDAFFPFPDCVEIAHKSGITAVIQPGGSKKDQASIDYCNKHNVAMYFTGTRHFRH